MRIVHFFLDVVYNTLTPHKQICAETKIDHEPFIIKIWSNLGYALTWI